MSALQSKKILLGITGGIAAYKAAFLVRLLVKKGAEVRVVLSPDALEFVTPLTLATLSKNPVEWEFTKAKGEWNNHVELALWADLMILAPATSNTLAKMNTSLCDNLLMAVYLSAKCPVFAAPAMDLDMYRHPGNQQNLKELTEKGVHIIPAESGELASGLSGEGRMAEPENIVQFVANCLSYKPIFKGKRILISAGPTYERIDPVRFVGNFSSGKMGYALAEKAALMGAQVVLVSGPTALKAKHPDISTMNVVTALEMKEAMEKHYPEADVVIKSAAVADYRPEEFSNQKIKKKSEELSLKMVKNPDILAGLGSQKQKQFLVGFALETNDERSNAEKKLKSKNLDAIVLNSLQDPDAGFGKDTNKITIIDSALEYLEYPAKPKNEVAEDILNFIHQKISK